MHRFKHKVINRLISITPFWLLNKRHDFNNRKALMTWLNDDPFIFHVPKTGGTSIAKAMGRAEAGHQTYQGLINTHPSVRDKKNYYFISRDPVDRIVSTYRYINMLHAKFGTSNLPQAYYHKTIEDFVENFLSCVQVENHYFLRPVTKIIGGIDKGRVWVINFNGLSRNYHDFMEIHAGIKCELPYENVSRVSEVNCISNETRQKIRSIYAEDVKIHSALNGKPFSRLQDIY